MLNTKQKCWKNQAIPSASFFVQKDNGGVCICFDPFFFVNYVSLVVLQDKVYPLLQEAEMIVLASPIYYHHFSGQLVCAMNRIYALDKPQKLKKAALIMSSGSDHVYSGAIFTYQNSFLNYLHLEDMGIFSVYGEDNDMKSKLNELRDFGQSL
ncbi:NADPH-dependent FMN reductase [Clostridiales bacterium CHKCI006]|nr:NADPH-dependent FMN reductase [Clostridiales bacterium CHKCI006]